MNRTKISLLLLLLLMVAAILAMIVHRDKPTYRTFTSPPPLTSITHASYTFFSAIPFAGGRMWIMASTGTNNFHWYRYDIEARTILGELKGASPLFELTPEGHLLCSSQITPPRN